MQIAEKSTTARHGLAVDSIILQYYFGVTTMVEVPGTELCTWTVR